MIFGETIFYNYLNASHYYIILNGSQLDTWSLIQAERDKKVLKRIQKKMMCTRCTLDWSQSSNISCCVWNCALAV